MESVFRNVPLLLQQDATGACNRDASFRVGEVGSGDCYANIEDFSSAAGVSIEKRNNVT